MSIALEDPWDNQGLDGIYIDESLFEAEQVRAGRPGSLQCLALPCALLNSCDCKGPRRPAAWQPFSTAPYPRSCSEEVHLRVHWWPWSENPDHLFLQLCTCLGMQSVLLASLVLTGNCSRAVQPAAAGAQ